MRRRRTGASIGTTTPGFSDTYEGGDLRILVDEDACSWPVVPRGRGDLIAFGASTVREVTPVDSGERWVALGWVYTNHDRRRIR